jgi:dolichol-phosphate mannosyltransferase
MRELSIIVPTYNERPNLVPLFRGLAVALPEIDYEVVIVDDDSPDHTAAMVRSLAQHDSRVRVLQRVGRRGLASAAVEGMLATSSPYLLVMDADLQHDERIIPAMLEKLKAEALDVVVGSRYVAGGSVGAFAADRVALSNLGRKLSSKFCHVSVSDPMSGFFLITREYFHHVVHNLSSIGFKILVDLLASARRPMRIGEVGYVFRNRLHGESKLDVVVGLEYLQLLLDKITRGIVPVSYLLYGLVGSIGVTCNFVLAALFMRSALVDFENAQLSAAIVTIAVNFILNNRFTFRGARLRGVRALQGLVLYYVACSVGLFAQVMIASSLQRLGVYWTVATVAGIGIGSIWNYSMACLLVWRVRRRRTQRLQVAYANLAWREAEPTNTQVHLA